MWEGHLRPVLDLVGPALSLSPASASFLDGALNDGFGEGVMSVKHGILSVKHILLERPSYYHRVSRFRKMDMTLMPAAT